MDIKIQNYSQKLDDALLDFFYKSIYGIPTYKNTKGSDYVRVPAQWLHRYTLSDGFIIKIASINNKIIGSLGVTFRRARVKNKTMNIGCFVDNCIDLTYLEDYESVFRELFSAIEQEARKQHIDIICGWDYFQPSVENHESFYQDLGYSWTENDWYIGGNIIKGEYPTTWDASAIGSFWRFGFKLLGIKHRMKQRFAPKLPMDVLIRDMRSNDFKKVIAFLNNQTDMMVFGSTYEMTYYENIIKNNGLHVLIAEKNKEVIGVLTYFTTAWSGMMFGKPGYDQKWNTIYGFLPDEFIVHSDYQNTSVPIQLVFALANINNPKKKTRNEKGYTFISDVVGRHKDLSWKRKAYLSFGCQQPKVGHGVILAKSLTNEIQLDTELPWHLPNRHIVAPVPENM